MKDQDSIDPALIAGAATLVSVIVSGLWAFFTSRSQTAVSKTLEVLRAEQTLPAEIRRQVAGKKVEAILRLVEMAEETVQRVYSVSSREDLQGRTAAVATLGAAYRAALIFVGKDTSDRIHEFIREVAHANGIYATAERTHQGIPPDLDQKGEEARDRMFEALRVELQLGQQSKTESRTDP